MFEQLYTVIWNAVANQQNQFLSGGLMLMLVGAIAAYARRLPGRIYHWLLSRCIITLDITNEDPAFFWFAGWLSKQPYSRRARNLTVTTYKDSYGNLRRGGRGNDPQCAPTTSAKESAPQLPEIILTPAPGNHVFFYKRRPVWLVRNRENQKPTEGGFSFMTKESFQIRLIARSQGTAHALIEEARQMSYVEKEVRTDLYVYTGYEGFRRVDSCDPRPLSSVFLPAGQSEDIVGKIRRFLGTQDWYRRRGIPWRISFLFHGLPGTGKTSIIRAVTGEFKMDLSQLNLSGSIDDSRLAYALASIPPRSAILLEDVDAMFNQREKSDDTDNKLSFSGLVNALDGAASREGWIVFMTTNHKDRLDPALIRRGRADHHYEFGHATAYQGQSIFSAFFPESDGAEMFGRIIEERVTTMADVQHHLVEHQNSAVEALAALDLLEAVEEVA
jgi:chaperone BCS1